MASRQRKRARNPLDQGLGGYRCCFGRCGKVKNLLVPTWKRTPSNHFSNLYTECADPAAGVYWTSSYNLNIIFGLLTFISSSHVEQVVFVNVGSIVFSEIFFPDFRKSMYFKKCSFISLPFQMYILKYEYIYGQINVCNTTESSECHFPY
jgi:hypothetical protein